MPREIDLAYDAQNQHSQFGTFLPSMSNRTFQVMCHTSNTATGCPYKFRSRRTTGSSDVGPRLGQFCVVVDVSRCLDTLTWGQADTASAVCGLIITPITFAAVICDADGPCLVNAAYEPESSFTVSHRSTTRPLHFWNICSNSEFLRWHKSISVEK